jgi:phospholipid transport system substrate-binding protein
VRNMISKLSLFLAVALVAPYANARDEAPDAMLNAVIVEVISILNQDGDRETDSAAKVADLVESKILPLFNFPRITQIAMARNWRLASAEQRALLTAEFKTLLVRTCSAALSNYRDRMIEFKRTRMSPGDTEVRVKSEVKQPGRELMAIDYDMEMTPAGWKVYDVKVGGVSLVATFRGTFADAVRDEGVDGLIRTLSDKNRQTGPEGKSSKTTFWDQSRIVFAMLQSALQGRR